MIEPLWHPFAGKVTHETEDYIKRRDEAIIWRATNLAINSALDFGQDLPVGAVAAQGEWITGRFFASDRRYGPGYDYAHAERMAYMEARTMSLFYTPDTIGVTLEPCDDCQDFLAAAPAVSRVVFSLSREDAANRGLVKPHDETIFDRVKRLGYGLEVVQLDQPDLREAGGLVLDFARRDIRTGQTIVDSQGLRLAIQELNARQGN
jgi:pyrimidine deaminase RibD-like protein